jgi:hypothetical protein
LFTDRDFADDRQHKAGWISLDVRRSQHYLLCFSSLIFDKTYFSLLIFDIVLVKFGLQETQTNSADARPNHHSKLGASQFLSRRITRSCVQLMPAPAAAAAAPVAANLAPVNSCLEE